MMLTCCAAESDWQLSRDRQHPHILKGKQKHPVTSYSDTQGNIHSLKYEIKLKEFEIFFKVYGQIVSFICSPLLERPTWSSPLLSLCSSRDIPESRQTHNPVLSGSVCTCFNPNNETAVSDSLGQHRPTTADQQSTRSRFQMFSMLGKSGKDIL